MKKSDELYRWTVGKQRRFARPYTPPTKDMYISPIEKAHERGRPECLECGTYMPKIEMEDEHGQTYMKCANCGYAEM